MPHLNLLTKIILVLGIILMAIGGGFAYRMSQGPLDLAFMKERVEHALSDAGQGYQVKIGTLSLIWPRVTEPLLLELKNVRFMKGEVAGSSINNVALGVSVRHLLLGQIKPAVVIVEGPVFQLVKQEEGYKFFWQGTALKKQEASINNKPQNISQNLRVQLDRILNPENTEYEILSALKRVEIKNAVVRTRQKVTEQDENNTKILGLIDLILQKNDLGLQGDLNIKLPAVGGVDSFVKSDVMYRRAEKDLTFTATIEDINPALFAPYFPDAPLLGQDLLLDGQVKAALDNNFRLQQATLDLNVPEGVITIPEAYDDGLDLKDIIFKAHLNLPEKKLDITDFKARVAGVPVEGKANAVIEPGKISAPVSLTISETNMDQVAKIFPKSHKDSSAGQWITQRLKDGVLRDVVLTTDFHVITDPETGDQDAKMVNTKASFKTEGMTIKYSETLMPVKQAVAEGRYEDDTLYIKGTSGFISDVRGRNIDLKMTNLSVKGGGMAYLTLDAKGPFKSVLAYASDEPIGLGDTLGFDIKTVKGDIDFNLNLEFPTIKNLPKEEVTVKIKGKLNNVLVPNIVQGLPLTGGPYDLTYADGAIGLQGKGQLAGRDIDLIWTEYLDMTGRDYQSKITAKIIADEGLRGSFNIGLEDYISGPIPLDVTYIDRGQKATIDIAGKLGPATLHLDPFKYKKEPGVPGELTLKAHMDGEDLQEVSGLSLSTEGFSLSGGRLIFKTLPDGSTDVSRGSIAQALLGKTKTAVEFENTNEGVLKVIAKADVVDATPFIQTEKKSQAQKILEKEEEQPLILSLETPRLLMNNDMTLTSSKLYLETDKQGDITRIEMDANVGNGTMLLRFRPENDTGKRTFRLESSDAGATLKAFDLTDKVRNGTLTIYGQPQQGDYKGNLYGKALLENFRVRKAPALAKLLGAMSLNGVQALLDNDGLTFAKLESDFEWRFREEGNLLVMKKGRTSGSSLGLTFEGVINQQTNETDISGTVIPLSGVNKAIGEIPLIGKVLTGGKAFLAATYTMKGPSQDPKVTINPLSVLAPGFLRSILFEEKVETKVKKQE